ncbi:MAG: copper chaperone CopZ [Crocinitomix sp.]|jgi:copper chaperone CopZ
MKHTYKITGMTCSNCEANVEKALNEAEHITEATFIENAMMIVMAVLMLII